MKGLLNFPSDYIMMCTFIKDPGIEGFSKKLFHKITTKYKNVLRYTNLCRYSMKFFSNPLNNSEKGSCLNHQIKIKQLRLTYKSCTKENLRV